MATPITSRQSIDLTGIWRFQPDAYADGDTLGYHLLSTDTRLWREVSVPGAFDDCAPEMAAYEGAGWFRRRFELPEECADQFAALRFEGVNYHAAVWVNGRFAGAHQGGFLRFELPVRHLLQTGENVVVVRADNTRRHGEVPGKERGWRPYGGILRQVALDIRPLIRLEQPVVAARADGGFEARISVVNDADWDCRAGVMLVVKDGAGATVASLQPQPADIAAFSRAELRFHDSARGIIPWTPETPALYTFSFVLAHDDGVDQAQVATGFRTIEAQGTQLLLNGRPVRLLGFNRHEDTPGRGMAPDPAAVERDLRHIKQLGANFVRLCHYPHHPLELDLCDQLGLLAMGEIPLYWWNGDADGDQPAAVKLAVARQQLGEMIARDINHPCIILWSVSNENQDDRPEVAAGNAELVDHARHLDPTRLAVHVSDHWTAWPRFDRDDVLCLNAYPSWSGRCWQSQAEYDFAQSAQWWRDRLDDLHARYPDKPVLITEFGYPALYGVFGNALGEDAQAATLQAEISALDKPYVCGMTIWCYADHPWPEEDFIHRLTNSPFGVVTRDRRPKRAASIIPALFGVPARPAPAMPALDNISVTMLRPHLRDIPDAPFPAGYSIRPMRRHEGGLWEDVQRDAEPFFPIEPGLFEAQFGDDPGAIERRCYLAIGPDGCAVGTISAWYLRGVNGRDMGRIHWVSVRRAHQGKGVGKAELSHALKHMAQWHDCAILDTSTGRVGAIKMYLDFGFVPDLDQPWAREAWTAFRQKVDHPALAVLDGA